MIKYILVDDEPKILKKVKEKIDSLSSDYELKHVASYHSSKKAFEEVKKEDYDLLIVDFEMPVYNGMELAKKIASGKKVIFLTSTIDNERKVINTLDISGYLSKPFEVEEFEAILKNKIIGKIEPTISYQKGDLVTLSISTNKDIGIYPEEVFFISTALIADKLSVFNFEKINQSTIVNGNYVIERDNRNLKLRNCKEPFEISIKEKFRYLNRIKNVFRFK